MVLIKEWKSGGREKSLFHHLKPLCIKAFQEIRWKWKRKWHKILWRSYYSR